MSKHTPLPWRVGPTNGGRFIAALKEKCVCEFPSGGVIFGKVDAANRDLVLRAVNCHDDLVAACTEIVRVLDALGWANVAGDWPVVTEACGLARAAIKKSG